MEKNKKLTSKKLIIILASVFVICGVALVALKVAGNYVKKVSTKEKYEYYNPDETKADADEGFKIDGVLDEDAYKNSTWLYAHNENGDSKVDLAMTSYYGEKGVYYVYDVTETTSIYVNPDRSNYCNSGIEMYMAPENATNLRYNNTYEMNLLPTGEVGVYRSNGSGGFSRGETNMEYMPYLGATTKGGEVNSEDCHGYCLELFIPWEYFETQGSDMEELKNGFMYINPAHITSYNVSGKDLNSDRFWYSFATQLGGDGWSNVQRYFKFGEEGLIGSVPIHYEQCENASITGSKTIIPGMKAYVTITPEEGYALNSILVNGEERIKKVSYNEDGSVTLALRSKGEEITVSAKAEKITEGNKNLRGTVYMHKVGGDNLNGVEISYKGPNGELPITLDANGSFELKDLKQGYYTIIVTKEGYQKLAQGISLRRDIDTELWLEYDFLTETEGTCWDIDEQNDGVLTSIGGYGVVLTKDTYNKFSVEANFRFDEEVKAQSTHSHNEQQRTGIRIKFSNGKYWHIDVLQQEGDYFVQYAKLTEDSIYNWQGVHTMDAAEIAKYRSSNGINLKVVRDGQYANVYLDNKFIVSEDLGAEYKDLTAQVGFESYAATKGVGVLKFDIKTKNVKVEKNPYFARGGGWDISQQFNGLITLPNGGHNAKLKFSQKYTDMDLTLTLRNYAEGKDGEEDSPRKDVRFAFENGKAVSFGILQRSADGDVIIQSMGEKNALANWTKHYTFTEQEKALFNSEEGIQFRIVRIGTEFALYINGKMVKVCDYEGKIEADTKADIFIRHWGDSDVDVKIPFSMKTKLDKVTIVSVENQYGKAVGEKKTYLIGDTVVLNGKGVPGYACVGVTVDGKKLTPNEDGVFSFKAEKSKHVVESEFAVSIFADSPGWSILKQYDGFVTLVGGGHNKNLKFSNKQGDISLTLNVKNYQEVTETSKRVDVKFNFDNGKYVTFGVVQEKGKLYIESMKDSNSDKNAINGWKFEQLTNEEYQKFNSEEGIQFKIVRTGTAFSLYVDGVQKKGYDLEEHIDANTKAEVSIRHWGDEGVNVKIPFSVNAPVSVYGLTTDYGKVTLDKSSYFVGDTIKLVVEPKEGYICSGLKANGKALTAGIDGSYSFVATEESYTLEAVYESDENATKKIFADGSGWDTSKQHEGRVTLPQGGYSKTLKFAVKYVDVDLTLKVRSYDASTDNTRVDVRFDFENGKYVTFGVVEEKGNLYFESMKDNNNDKNALNGWKFVKLSAEAYQKFNSETGVTVRIVRTGTKFTMYLDGVKSWEYDAGENISADMKAELHLRHWGDAGIDVEIPFNVGVPVTLKGLKSDNGTVKTDKDTYYVGETVKLTVEPKNGYKCTGLKVNGNEVNADKDGVYSFTATEKSYTIEASYTKDENAKKKIFDDGSGWDTSKQYEGIVTLPEGGYNNKLRFADQYVDVALVLEVRSYDASKDNTRVDVRFDFENGKYVTFGIVEENKKLYIESMKDNNTDTNALNGWKYLQLSAEAYQKFNSESGVQFEIVRTGTKFTLYLDGVKSWEYDAGKNISADMKADLHLRHWGDAGTDVKIPFTLKTAVFADGSKWNTSNQLLGSVTLPEGGHDKTLKFAEKYSDVDLTLKVRSYDASTDNTRVDVRFDFENGKYVTFGIVEENKKLYFESMKDNNTDTNVLNGWKYLQLSAEAYQKFNSETGVEVRIVRIGTKFTLYLDGVKSWEYDAGENISADMKADLHLRHWGDAGTDVEIPFSVRKPIVLQGATEGNGTVATVSTSHFVGDDVTLKVTPNAGYICIGLKVDGKSVTLKEDGTYTFAATKEVYEVEAVYWKKVFADGSKWDISKQHEGIVRLSKGGHDKTLKFAEKYSDIDLTLKVRSYDASTDDTRVDVRFDFENGKYVTFGIVEENKKLYFESMKDNNTDTNALNGWKYLQLSTEAYQKFNSETGVEVRIVRTGTKFTMYLDGVKSWEYDAGEDISADMKAELHLRHWGDIGTDTTISFSVKDKVTLKQLMTDDIVVSTASKMKFIKK